MNAARSGTTIRTILRGELPAWLGPDTWEYFAPCDVVGPGHAGGGLPAPQLVLSAMGDPASLCVAFPPAPELIGQAFCVQGASLEVGVCFRATDALCVVIQP